ncbi:bifunctional diaminohydroxyphosphoribosylaminopyrimidine deaminase/5-amino-6-(5-phosphoribosylamino)uracil reductase RibD [Alicyclobacillus pomorum]
MRSPAAHDQIERPNTVGIYCVRVDHAELRPWENLSGDFCLEGRRTNDKRFMQMALQAAEAGRGQTSPNPLVGAVIVRDGEVVGVGAHLKAGTPHAEVHALRMAGDRAEGATVYVTLEPCSHHGRTPPCCDALIAAKVQRVVVALTDPNPVVSGEGIRRLREAGILVEVGVCANEAARQNEAYLTWRRKARPFVLWKCAATLDGYIAAPNGHSTYVTGEVARQEVQMLRRSLSAIAVGVGTVLADDPRLTVREQGHPNEVSAFQPVRVVFDSQLRTPPTAALLDQPGRTIIYCTGEAIERRTDRAQALSRSNVDVVPVVEGPDGRVSLRAALKDLGQRGYISVLVEGGCQLSSALLEERLVDKVVYYVAPKLLGRGIPALNGPVPDSMAEAIDLCDVTWTQVGSDIRVEGYPVYKQDPSTKEG